jgi:hypothetical protein
MIEKKIWWSALLCVGLIAVAPCFTACDSDDDEGSGDTDTDGDGGTDTDTGSDTTPVCPEYEWGPASGLTLNEKIGNWTFNGYYDENANWVVDPEEEVEKTFTMDEIACYSGAQSLIILLDDLS